MVLSFCRCASSLIAWISDAVTGVRLLLHNATACIEIDLGASCSDAEVRGVEDGALGCTFDGLRVEASRLSITESTEVLDGSFISVDSLTDVALD